MLFNSYGFIFLFLPATLLSFYLAAWFDRRLAMGWLVVCSLFFYGWWNPHFVVLLVGSIAFNYTASRLIELVGPGRPRARTALLTAGIGGDLLLLFFYKYLFALAAFFGLSDALPSGWANGIILPLGISFFTFTQIGYLVDSSEGMVKQRGLLDYVLFVTFFPHLIAGPILHNQEMIPQFANPATYRFRLENLTVGLSIFVIGLCKKVIIADPFGRIADPGFALPHALSAYGAWQAALSYSLQLYFDFSGYSDMAIGIARMFGIVFPLNFNSPYKSRSIIDFWQRWHMTLTRYLNLYLYNPVALRVTRRRLTRGLGISRQATRNLGGFASMVVLPVFFTMTLAGVWHGAGLQFLIFGLLHAIYLSINHAWRIFGPKRKGRDVHEGPMRIAACVAATFLAVIVAQVFFRSNSTSDAFSLIGGMLGLHPVAGAIMVPGWLFGSAHGLAAHLRDAGLITLTDNATELKNWLQIALGFVIVWAAPNTQQIMFDFAPVLGSIKPFPWPSLRWRPGVRWGLVMGALLLASLCNLENVSRFLYFQF